MMKNVKDMMLRAKIGKTKTKYSNNKNSQKKRFSHISIDIECRNFGKFF